MATKSLNGVLQHVRVLAAVQTGRAHTDQELLERFVGHKDEAAFTVLIERHGPMVFGVCRRALKHAQDAEDACQATFLVFARKAGSKRKTTSLGSWLHGIACRISANLKRQQARRQKREKQAAWPPAQPDVASTNWDEVQAILDEELGRLPERYRAPLLLCYWEGITRDEAAAQLGLSTGKLHGLLERGRTLLRERLTRRGLTLPAALCASLLAAATTNAALAPTLVVASTKAALRLAAGEALSPSLVSGQVMTLTKEVLGTMFLTKLKVAAVSALGVGFVAALIGGSLAGTGWAQDRGGKAAGIAKDAAKSESDEEVIRGTWVVVELQQTNHAPTEEEKEFFKKGGYKITITGDKMSHSPDQSEVKYRLDTTRTPGVLELLEDGKVIAKAIYELKGDDLKFCLGRRPKGNEEPEAPTDFDIKKAAPGTFPTLFVLKRATAMPSEKK
jgi:RNA polymerase sigma factor (sigma-70 family)